MSHYLVELDLDAEGAVTGGTPLRPVRDGAKLEVTVGTRARRRYVDTKTGRKVVDPAAARAAGRTVETVTREVPDKRAITLEAGKLPADGRPWPDQPYAVVPAVRDDGLPEGQIRTGETVAFDPVALRVTIAAATRPRTPGEIAAAAADEARVALAQSDRGMARLGEDLVDVLVGQGVIGPEALPPAARDLLARRKALRALLEGRAAP